MWISKMTCESLGKAPEPSVTFLGSLKHGAQQPSLILNSRRGSSPSRAVPSVQRSCVLADPRLTELSRDLSQMPGWRGRFISFQLTEVQARLGCRARAPWLPRSEHSTLELVGEVKTLSDTGGSAGGRHVGRGGRRGTMNIPPDRQRDADHLAGQPPPGGPVSLASVCRS